MQAKKLKIIKVSSKGRLELQKKYGCVRETVFNALGFRSHSEQAEKIRQDAINLYGGVKIDKVVFN